MKILVISHAHPELSAGGGERAAYSLFEHVRRAEGVEQAVFLARASSDAIGHSAPIGAFRGRQDELLACPPDLDPFTHTALDYARLEEIVDAVLKRFRPDVAHVHHFAFWGLELFEILKKRGVRVIFTLHEFIAICHRQGQMLKTNGRLCTVSSAAECSACFPSFTPGKFFLREKMFKAFFGHVDHFIAPSRFLADRYVAWGLPAESLSVVENPLALEVLAAAERIRARIAARPRAPEPEPEPILVQTDQYRGPDRRKPRRARPRVRIGFFGQINPYKGIDVLLEALALLDEEDRAGLYVGLHGANLDMQEAWFRDKITAQLDEVKDCVSLRGPYQNNRVLELMADYDWIIVPSIWWENSPVVIQEALAVGKPILCSRIGGMAEKVVDGETGLYFEPGSASDLAGKLMELGRTPSGTPQVPAGADLTGRVMQAYH
jgi:glycosyltransferase involved in cell wall biosynthesis